MKILLYIYIAVSALSLMLNYFTSRVVAKEFKRKYPNVEVPKLDVVDKIGTFLKLVLIHSIPIINGMFLLLYLFCDDKVINRTVEKVYKKVYGGR